MENLIYNELMNRGYNIDVGVVTLRDKDEKKQIEIDFIAINLIKILYSISTRSSN